MGSHSLHIQLLTSFVLVTHAKGSLQMDKDMHNVFDAAT